MIHPPSIKEDSDLIFQTDLDQINHTKGYLLNLTPFYDAINPIPVGGGCSAPPPIVLLF